GVSTSRYEDQGAGDGHDHGRGGGEEAPVGPGAADDPGGWRGRGLLGGGGAGQGGADLQGGLDLGGAAVAAEVVPFERLGVGFRELIRDVPAHEVPLLN